MMDRTDGVQQRFVCVTLESLMPERHFLRDLDRLVDFSFIYDLVAPLYSHTGRRSIDPVVVIKMMLLGYLYGINSERRLVQEIQVNIAFRWFLGIDLDDPVPDHSVFSQLRRRKFNGTSIFDDIFTGIVRQCIQYGLVSGKLLLTDSTHVRANVRNDLYETITVTEEPSAYVKRLNEQAVKDGLLKADYEDRLSKKEKEVKLNKTDPESGFMYRPGKPMGFHYLSHQTCDSEHGIITDVYVTPGNVTDCTVHSERIQHQIDLYQFDTEAVCADSGYDTSEIHHDMLERGIKTYIPEARTAKDDDHFTVDDFQYDESTDTLICPNGARLKYSSYLPRGGCKQYRASQKDCDDCPYRDKCLSEKATYKRVTRTYYKKDMDTQHKNNQTWAYREALRLRQIWCEGNFSHQKAHHNLTRVRMWGLGKASEHCLLSACALNLKRMVKLLGQDTRKVAAQTVAVLSDIIMADHLIRMLRMRASGFLFGWFVNSTILITWQSCSFL